jgi:O-antigen/teichoic acid export membrane protein
MSTISPSDDVKKRLLPNAAFAVLQVVVSGVVLFFLYGYLLRSLGPEALGMWTLLMAATSLATISNLGLAGGLVSFVSKYLAEGEGKSAAAAIETTILAVAFVMGLVSACLWPLLYALLGLIIPAESLAEARDILPYAILAFWFGALGGAVHSALDGCHRADLRSISTMLCQPIVLIGVLWLSPSLGLIGLAYAQIAQYVLWILLGWLLLRGQIKALPLIPWRWHKTQFLKMWLYGVNFQLISIMVILSEPLAKGLLSYYTNLSTVAYFEMANRLILQVRGVITSANQVITPYISKVHAIEPSKVVNIYLESLRLVSLTGRIAFSVIIAAGPLVSVLWLGKLENQFVIFLVMLSLGWFINTLAVPAYFANLGLNNMGPNVRGHFAMMVAMVTTALVTGPWAEPYGIAIAWPVGLVIGSYIINTGLIRALGISKTEWINRVSFNKTAVLFAFGISACLSSMMVLKSGNSISQIMATLILLCVIFANMLQSYAAVKHTLQKSRSLVPNVSTVKHH